MQDIKRRPIRYLEDQPILSTSPRLKTKRMQGKELKNTRKGQSASALVAHRTVRCETVIMYGVHQTTCVESSTNGHSGARALNCLVCIGQSSQWSATTFPLVDSSYSNGQLMWPGHQTVRCTH
jgi:hypothetical protein